MNRHLGRGLLILVIVFVAYMVKPVSAEEKTVTLEQTAKTISEIPAKVSTHLQNEWIDIKAYQKESWQNSKDQFARNKTQIGNLFTKIKQAFTQ